MSGRSVAQRLGERLSPSGPVSSRWLTIAAVALGAILAWALFTMTWTGWREFRMPDGSGFDLATLNQGFYLALHGHGGLHTTVPGERYHRFILPVAALNHFSPNFYLFLPFYAGWQSSLLLLLLASIAVAATGVALLFAARLVFGRAAIALVWFGLFALHPTILWSVPTNGFHEVFVAMGFLSFALLYYLKGQNRLFALMLVLAILSKEDIPLLLPVWGMVAWFHGKGWRLALGLALLGVAYFLLANAIALPLIRGHHVGDWYFNAWGSPLGETPKDILHSISSAPGEIPRMALGQQNLWFWAALFSPLLFLPLLGWEYLVIPAYIYVEISLSGRFQVIPSYHVLPAIPFIFVAAMVGASRLVDVIARIPPLRPIRSAAVRNVSLAALLCGVVGSTLHSTPFLDVVRGNWPTEAGLRQDAPLFQALARIPPQASLAATLSLVAESPSRDELYSFNSRAMAAHEPDYLAIDMNDLNYDYLSDDRAWIASRLCRGTYGVVYADRNGSRMLLERGASLAANPGAYAALVPGSRHECPPPAQEAMSPEIFTRAASFHVRSRFPSEIRPNDTFLEPVIAVSDTRFAQVIHLPDHTFEPGWYQLDLIGAWPWLWAPASFQLTARILVGERTVGQVAAGGDQPLHYTTQPFRIDRRATLPLRVRVELQTPGGQSGTVGALRATREGCAVVADAPSLNSQRITVGARVYPEGLVQHPGTEAEAPILSKGKARGYYLRLSGDDQGKVWVDVSVAGKWAAGRAGTVPLRKWTHVAATYDGQEVRIYIDGRRAPQEPSRSPKHTGRIQSQGAPLAIGCRDPGTLEAEAFPGLIESASVWNRVLTPQEIQEDAVGSSFPTLGLAGLVGSWDFRDLRGGIVPDLSAAGNPVTNGAGLTRVPAPAIKQPFAAWRARELNVLRLVTVTEFPIAHVRDHFPSELRTDDMSPEPVSALSANRFAQTIHLPDHIFKPGWYRLDLAGGWPWSVAPESYQLTARVLVGERAVGQVTVGGDQPLRYTTPPFHINRRETLPIRVQADLWIPEGRDGLGRAFRPIREGCAIVADAPGLNPQHVTVEALVYRNEMPRHPGAETEAPILSKNNAPGYYLRLSGDDRGKVWIDFNVAGKWALGQAGVGLVPLRRWTAIAATYDGQEAKIYINGRRALQDPSRSPQYAGSIRSRGAPLVIGCRDAGQPYEVVFPGLIGSARVWNRVLTPQEVQKSTGMWPLPAKGVRGLVGSWGFQAIEGSVIPDFSGAGNPITNGRQLTRVLAPAIPQPLAAWRARDLNVLRVVTVRTVTP